MHKYFVGVFLFWGLLSVSFGQNWLPSQQGQRIDHQYFSLSYMEDHEQAEWVAYELTAEKASGEFKRINSYREDPTVPSQSAYLSDYKNSGFDRGHLMPAADAKFDPLAMSESFFLSNMSPQRHEFNSGIWNSLEMKVRKWAKAKGRLYVITGPVLVQYEGKIGRSGVSIPSSFYKVLLQVYEGDTSMIGFLLPHTQSKKSLADFVVPVDSIEQLTGIDFFPYLPDNQEYTLESGRQLGGWFQGQKKKSKDGEILTISPEEAELYNDEKVIVCGAIVATKYLPNSAKAITYLNFSKAYPETPFTAVVFGESRVKFPEAPEEFYLEKEVCVRGRVVAYRGNPQMVIHHPNQIEVK